MSRQPTRTPAGEAGGRFAVLITFQPGPAPGEAGSEAPGGTGCRASGEADPRAFGAGPQAPAQGAGWPRALELQRHLWFRFVVTVECVGAGTGVRRAVDVLVDPDTEAACPGPPAGLVTLFPVPGALGQVGEYELRRLAPVALEKARAVARQELQAQEAGQAAALAAERALLEAHFAARRRELLICALEGARKARAALAYRCVAAGSEPATALVTRARRLAAEARRRQEQAALALQAVDAEERRALEELAARFRPSARIEPVGLAVLWMPPGPPDGP